MRILLLVFSGFVLPAAIATMAFGGDDAVAGDRMEVLDATVPFMP